MTTEQQKDYIHETQRYKTEVELINESPKYSHDLPFLDNPARAGIDNVGRLQALSQKYKQDIYRAYIRTLNYYKNEYKKQQQTEIKKNQAEELLAQQKEILAQQLKIKENKINAKVFKRQLQIEKTQFILQQQRQLQQLEIGVVPDMSNYIQKLTQSNSTSIEQEQSQDYSIEIPQLTRNTYIEHIINEPTIVPIPEPTIVPIPEPEQEEEEEPERDPQNFYMTNRFANRRRAIHERWDNPDLFKEWKEKPTILAKDTTIDTLVDDGYCRIDRINIKDTHGDQQEFYVSRYNRQTIYHQTEPTYNKQEDTLDYDDETYEPEYYQPLDKYRCVCGCRRVIGWYNEYLSVNKDDDDMSCAFREHNLYIKYKGDWKAILKHQHLPLSPLE